MEKMIAHWCFVLLLCYGFIVQINGLFRTRGLFPPRTDPNLLVVSEMVHKNAKLFTAKYK